MHTTATSLPIEPLLSQIADTLNGQKRLILAAPPGAGKTSRVPLALAGLIKGFSPVSGRILVLQPRRIAARLAAERLASTIGEDIGMTVGLSTRIDRRVSDGTKIEVMTDGVFVRRALASPDLESVGAVLFDEIHERSLNMDLGLALAIEIQSVFRGDLQIGLMSATLDTDSIRKNFDAPVIVSEGRQFPIETKYLGRDRERPIEHMVDAICRAARETKGSILAFLPGAGEIRRTAVQLEGKLDAEIAPLYGALSPAEQDRAIRVPKGKHRKIVLSTDIAESSLTIEGVEVVVDSGLARRPKQYPNGFGVSLVTERASRANVDQRRGRAGRTGPGVCYRLWDEAETLGLTRSPAPAILESDLAGLCLSLSAWGERDPYRLNWLDPPPKGRVRAGTERLVSLGAITGEGELTLRGKQMADLPLPPELAALIVSANSDSQRALAAEISVLLGEPSLGGPGPDLIERLNRFRSDTSQRAKQFRRQAQRWAGSAKPSGSPARLLAEAWPDRIARRRAAGNTWLLASGSAGALSDEEPLAKSDWLVVAELSGAAKAPRISQAVSISEAEIRSISPPSIEESATFEPSSASFQARRVERIGSIILSETPLRKPSDDAAKAAWLKFVETNGFDEVGLDEPAGVFLARLKLFHDVFGTETSVPTKLELQETVSEWLAPTLGTSGFKPPAAKGFADALMQRLSWKHQTALNQQFPLTLTLPTGRRAQIDWLDERAPLVEARTQEFYGQKQHPRIADGRVPITLQFLSPAGKPVATTQDLAGFWSAGYMDMAKEMRGRYPKHDWPQDPANATPHAGLTKARLNK